MTKKRFLLCWLLVFPFLLNAQSEWIKNHLESEFYKNHFVGFYLQDAETGQELMNYNGEKLFTPASNVKILSLYSAMKVLPDSIPALKYERKGDDLLIQGLGDPTFLHPEFKSVTRVLDFLKNETGKI